MNLENVEQVLIVFIHLKDQPDWSNLKTHKLILLAWKLSPVVFYCLLRLLNAT